MNDAFHLLAGAATATVCVVLAHLTTEARRYGIYGVGLVTAAGVYVVFAAAGDVFFLQELGGTLIFAAMAVAGMRGYPWALALGWALHVGWDMGLHGAFSPIAPAWYPLACVGFDLVIAGAVIGELALRKS